MSKEETFLNGRLRYATSKLLQVLCMRAVVAGMNNDLPVIFNIANPGLCHSGMTSHATGGLALFFNIFARRAEIGARAIVAGVAGGDETHGQYLQDGRPMTPGKMVVGDDGQALQDKVWGE